MRTAVIQHDIAWEDAAATIARVRPRVSAAAADGARLIVLTETFSVGFTARFAATAEPPDGPSTEFIRTSAVESGVWVTGSVMVQDADATLPSNTMTIAGPTGQVYTYRKIHTSFFDDERAQVAAGDELPTFEIDGLRVTPLVCYDLRFANVFWQAAPETDCYVVVANWPAARHLHWETLLRARAIENQAYVIASNRVGVGGTGTAFAGGSTVIDPLGTILAVAGHTEQTITADVDAAVVADVRARFPFQQHRVEAVRRVVADK